MARVLLLAQVVVNERVNEEHNHKRQKVLEDGHL
jgi:hypothetical protein